jgi:hypothetical protein
MRLKWDGGSIYRNKLTIDPFFIGKKQIDPFRPQSRFESTKKTSVAGWTPHAAATNFTTHTDKKKSSFHPATYRHYQRHPVLLQRTMRWSRTGVPAPAGVVGHTTRWHASKTPDASFACSRTASLLTRVPRAPMATAATAREDVGGSHLMS